MKKEEGKEDRLVMSPPVVEYRAEPPLPPGVNSGETREKNNKEERKENQKRPNLPIPAKRRDIEHKEPQKRKEKQTANAPITPLEGTKRLILTLVQAGGHFAATGLF